MIGFSPWALAGLLGAAVAASFAILWLTGLVLAKRQNNTHQAEAENRSNTFLFEDDRLVDLDSNSGQLPQNFTEKAADWRTVRHWLKSRFSGLPESLVDITPDNPLEIWASPKTTEAHLRLSKEGKCTRVTLIDDTPLDAAGNHETLRQCKLLEDFKTAMRDAPEAIWMTDADGTILWQNKRSEPLLRQGAGAFVASPESDPGPYRITATDPTDGSERCYEIKLTATGNARIHSASDITKLVHAETAQRQFVQTLTKTFANLTIGLAVFDRNRQLALFNPALVDLTGLPADFLSSRPTLMSFFDCLRDRQVLPEPKNYASWRAQINEVVETASGGLYQETWSLPTGLTYRVTGRPHPDGAVAFLFEDISAEISLTRRFRAQIDLRQSVIDRLDQAVAVISSDNILILCNQACTDLLDIDPDGRFADIPVSDFLAACNTRFPDCSFWSEVEEKIIGRTLDGAFSDTIGQADSSRLNCRVSPIPGGGAMLCLSLQHSLTTAAADKVTS